MFGQRPTWIEICLDSLVGNYKLVKKQVGPDIQVMAMVKANAYGHGLLQVALHLQEKAEVDWFGVAMPEEGVLLRKAGVKAPILCLSGFWNGQEMELLQYDLSTTVYRLDMLEVLDRASKKANKISKIHVKIDSGMGRLGIQISDIPEFIKKLKSCSGLYLEGLMTHFAAADEDKKAEFTRQQISNYQTALMMFYEEGLRPEIQHLSNSAGIQAYPEGRGNLVRIGGLLYGIAGDITSKSVEMISVKPVLSLHSKVILLKTIPSMQPIGYGCTFVTSRPSCIATLPIGYGDGLSRAHSNLGEVLILGRRVPIVGRVSMDLVLIDVTDVPNVQVGDVATLIGKQHDAHLTAEEYAKRVNTIALEATTMLSVRVPRYYTAT